MKIKRTLLVFLIAALVIGGYLIFDYYTTKKPLYEKRYEIANYDGPFLQFYNGVGGAGKIQAELVEKEAWMDSTELFEEDEVLEYLKERIIFHLSSDIKGAYISKKSVVYVLGPSNECSTVFYPIFDEDKNYICEIYAHGSNYKNWYISSEDEAFYDTLKSKPEQQQILVGFLPLGDSRNFGIYSGKIGVIGGIGGEEVRGFINEKNNVTMYYPFAGIVGTRSRAEVNGDVFSVLKEKVGSVSYEDLIGEENLIWVDLFYEIDEAYEYPLTPDMDEWKRLETHDDKIVACQIPKDILERLTTEALVESVMKCPLLIDMLAYDSTEAGYEVVYSYFNGLQELKRREDAVYYVSSYEDDGELTEVYKEIIIKGLE